MKVVRVEAALVVNTKPTPKGNRLCLLCGIGDDLRVLKGPWYGHEFAEGVTWPFTIRSLNEIFWGYEENVIEETNLDQRQMQIGEYITLFGNSAGDYGWNARLYQIVAVTPV
jgi:hypothetical protein